MKRFPLASLPALLLWIPSALAAPEVQACDPSNGPCPPSGVATPVSAPATAAPATAAPATATPATAAPATATPATAAPATAAPATAAPAQATKAEARHGVALRLQALGFGREEDRHQRAGLVGFGASYRYRVAKRFALDSGLDLIGGRDNHGLEHAELGALVNGVFTINPQNPFRVYGLFGIGLSTARVEAPADLGFSITPERRFYASGVLGVGLEWCAFSFLSLNLDLSGILRQRIDGLPAPRGPMAAPLAEDTAGGILRLGAIFYFE